MDREQAYLVARLDRAAAGSSAMARDAASFAGAVCFLVGGGFGFITWHWGIAALFGAAGISVMLGTDRIVKRLPSQDMRPVVDAVRYAPERITHVRHFAAPDAHWVEVKTAESRLVLDASADWERLLRALRSRCPGADYA